MSEREELAEVIATALCKSHCYETGEGTCAVICMEGLGDVRKRGCPHAMNVHGRAALAAADAILSRRPADDEGLVEMAAERMFGEEWECDWTRTAAKQAALQALATYRAHDPALREMREALEPFATAYEEHCREHDTAASVGGWVPMDDDYPLDGIHLEHFARARDVIRKYGGTP